jgi:hypothetical protein
MVCHSESGFPGQKFGWVPVAESLGAAGFLKLRKQVVRAWEGYWGAAAGEALGG